MRHKTGLGLTSILMLTAGGYLLLKHRSHPMGAHPYLDHPGTQAMAHRGGQGLWPPNTIFAFERALNMGCDILELDIHATKDGHLVVRHDPTVDATSNGSGAIRDLSLAEIKALDAGYRWSYDGDGSFPYRGIGITIPTLQEVLDAFPTTRLNIDIKPRSPSVVPNFCQLLVDYNLCENVLVGSFHDSQLHRFRALCPEVATAAGPGEIKLFYALNRVFLGDIYQAKAHAFQIPEYIGNLRLISPHFIKSAHNHNIQVHIWTVNEVTDMQRLLSWGADGIITDFPDRLLKLLSSSSTRHT